MGVDSSASFGYGFKIPSKIVEDCEGFAGKDFEINFAGDSYAENDSAFILIKKSQYTVYTWEGGVKKFSSDKMVVQPDWDDKLKVWAKDNKIKNVKIGWYLLASLS